MVEKEERVEVLRGICAFIVMIGHLIVFSIIIEKNFTTDFSQYYYPPGHLSVLVFFVLSGYVIGISTPLVANVQELGSYLKKRLIRIFPLYAIAIIVSILVVPTSLSETLLNLFFLQVIFCAPLPGNNPVWSLNHEMTYYLLYGLLSLYQLAKGKKLIPIFLTLSLISFFILKNPLLNAYSTGFIFWLTGLFISRLSLSDTRYSANNIISKLLLFCCYEVLNPIRPIAFKLGLTLLSAEYFRNVITIYDLGHVFICITLFAPFINRKIPAIKSVNIISYLLPVITMGYFFYQGKLFSVPYLAIPTVIYLFSVILKFVNFEYSFSSASVLLLLGKISYGIYIIHMPILFLISKIQMDNINVIAAYLTKCVLILAASVGSAYFLEMKFYPHVKKILLFK